MNALKTELVSAVDLKKGDVVVHYGATMQVEYIIGSVGSDGNAVHACISRLISDECGSIPRGWFETPQRMANSGCTFTHELPDGLYFNVQGNKRSVFQRVIKEQ